MESAEILDIVDSCESEVFSLRRLRCDGEDLYLRDKLVKPESIGVPRDIGVVGYDPNYSRVVGRWSNRKMQQQFKENLQRKLDSLSDNLKEKVNSYALWDMKETHVFKREFEYDSMGMGGVDVTTDYYKWGGTLQFYHLDPSLF